MIARLGLIGAVAALLAGAFAPAAARSAEDYYHGAAHRYVEGKIQEASVEAEEGLRLNPADAKLNALAEHLRKMKDQQRGEGGEGKKQGKQDDKDQNESKDPKKDGDKNREGGDGKPQDKPPENPGKQDGKNPGRDVEKPDEGKDRDAPQPQKMSEEDAKRLLNSFADDEKKEQAERRKVIRSRAGTEQDW